MTPLRCAAWPRCVSQSAGIKVLIGAHVVAAALGTIDSALSVAGSPADVPTSIHGESASRWRSPVAVPTKLGGVEMLPSPAPLVASSMSEMVAEQSKRSSPLPQMMQLVMAGRYP